MRHAAPRPFSVPRTQGAASRSGRSAHPPVPIPGLRKATRPEPGSWQHRFRFRLGLLRLRDELQRDRVDAETQAGRRWAIAEDVSEVGVATAAHDLDPRLGAVIVGRRLDLGGCDRAPEARPARPRLELGARAEQRCVTANARVGAHSVVIHVLAGEGGLGRLHAGDKETGPASTASPTRAPS